MYIAQWCCYTERVTNDEEILSSALLESDFVLFLMADGGVYVPLYRAPLAEPDRSETRCLTLSVLHISSADAVTS